MRLTRVVESLRETVVEVLLGQIKRVPTHSLTVACCCDSVARVPL